MILVAAVHLHARTRPKSPRRPKEDTESGENARRTRNSNFYGLVVVGDGGGTRKSFLVDSARSRKWRD